MTLMKEDNAPIYGNCMSWVLGQLASPQKEAVPKILNYACNDYFTSKYSDKGAWEQNGCYQCIDRKEGLPKPPESAVQIGVCLEAVPTCATDYPFDSMNSFKEFTEINSRRSCSAFSLAVFGY